MAQTGSGQHPRPRFRHLAALLGLISPARPADTPMPSPEDWPHIEDLALRYHVAPMLWHRLRAGPALQEALATRLRQAYTANARRNRLLRRGLVRVAHLLNHAGLSPLLLKGAIYLVDPLSGNPATRYMHDLDLLVREDDGEAAFRSLQAAGFAREGPDQGPRHHHLPRLVDPASGIEVEIHTRPLLGCPAGLSSLYFQEALPCLLEDASILLPPPSLRIAHNVVHSQVIDMGLLLARLNPRCLLEFSQHCAAFDAADWTRALVHLKPYSVALGSWVHICRSLMGIAPPVPVSPGRIDRLQLCRLRFDGGDPMQYSPLSRLLGKVYLTLRGRRLARASHPMDSSPRPGEK